MNYINTHEVYKQLIQSGCSESDAEIHIKSFESIGNSLLNWLKEAKTDFASQKMISILGAIIIAVGGFCAVELWNISTDMKLIAYRVTDHDEQLTEIKLKLK